MTEPRERSHSTEESLTGARQAVDRQLARLQVLTRLSPLISASLDLGEVLRQLAEAASTLLGVPFVHFWVADETRQTLHRRALAGDLGADYPAQALRFGQGGVGWVAVHRRVLDAPDVYTDERTMAQDWFRAHGLRSYRAVPIVHRDSLLGVLALLAREAFRWDQDDEVLLDALVAQAAVAIRNARLYEEAELERARYRGLAEGSIQGVAILVDETIAFANPALAGIFGYASPEELIGQHFSVLLPPEERARVDDDRAARLPGEPAPSRDEKRVVKNDGTRIWVETLASAIDWGGRPAIFLAIVDITERKQAEEALRASEDQLRQAQRMEAVGRLAGGIAHDFNNLLTVIDGRCQLLLHRLGSDSPLWRNLELVRHTAEQASRLTRQLLAFSRQQVLRPRVVDLNTVVGGMVPMLQRMIGENIELGTQLSPALGSVKADRGQLEQIVVNLAVNARDAMPQRGRLTVETADVEFDAAFVQQNPGATPGPHVMLAVSDTGAGMTAEVQAHLFEPFFTTKEVGKGTGLGLATVYTIVKQHTGHIRVLSEVGRGTRFEISFPRVDESPESRETVPAARPAHGGSETILLVEDEQGLRDLAQEVLCAQGYVVLEARHPGEALLIGERHQGPIHLLLTDVIMPHMNGRELAARLRASRSRLKVLYMSGYTPDVILRHEVQHAGIAFLQKPFSPDGLARKVRDALDAPGEGALEPVVE